MVRRRGAVGSRPLHHTISEEWQGLRRGDQVTVTGEGTFSFIEHVKNERSGSEWVTVVNPSGFRSFIPSRIKQVGASSTEDPFAAAVVRGRKLLGLSRQVVADQTGLRYQDVRRVEVGGKRKPGEEEKLLAFFEKLHRPLEVHDA